MQKKLTEKNKKREITKLITKAVGKIYLESHSIGIIVRVKSPTVAIALMYDPYYDILQFKNLYIQPPGYGITDVSQILNDQSQKENFKFFLYKMFSYGKSNWIGKIEDSILNYYFDLYKKLKMETQESPQQTSSLTHQPTQNTA